MSASIELRKEDGDGIRVWFNGFDDGGLYCLGSFTENEEFRFCSGCAIPGFSHAIDTVLGEQEA